jgi:hypothetical protein
VARFNVGEAFLQVTASVAGIHEKIAAEVAKIQDIQIDVTPNLDGFRERIAAEVAGIRDVEIDVEPNLTGFREKVAAATSGFGDISVHVNADVDDAAARAEMAALDAEASRLDGRNVRMKVDVDGQGASLMLTAISAAALAIAPAVAPATAALAAMPAVIAGVGAPVAALVAGFNGVGDAVKAMSAAQAAASGTAAEQAAANEKLAQAMAKLSPAAQSFVTTLQGQMVPALQALKFEVQQGVFPGLEQALHNIQPLIPTIAAGLANTGQVIGQLASQGAAMMASGPWRADFAQIMDSNNRALASFGQAGLSLLDAMRNLASAAGPLIERFASWAQSASATFATFIEGKRATGELGQAFQQAGDFIAQLSTVLGQVASGIAQLASAIAPLGSGFLTAIGAVAQFIGNVSQVSPLLAQITVAAIGLAPILSRLGTAFTFLQGLPAQLSSAASSFGGFVTGLTGSAAAGEKASSAVKALGVALPVLGAAFVAADAIQNTFASNEEQVAAAILKGGQAADQAKASLEGHSTIAKILTGEIVGIGTSWESASAKAEQMRAAMDPLARAQSDAARAQNEYLTAVDKFGPSSDQATTAAQRFQEATQQVKQQQDLANTAIKGTTAALQEQAAALGNTLSAHINFLNKVQGVNDALTKNKSTLDLSTQAGRDNAAAVNAMVQAAITWEQDAKKSGASAQELAAIHQQLSTAIQQTAGKFGTLPPEVQKVVDAFVKAKPNLDLKPNIDIAPATSQIGQLQAKIQEVPQNWFTKFAGDILGLSTAVGQASAGINTVPGDHPTAFTGDVNALVAATMQAKGSITAVEAQWLTAFLGDPGDITAKAAQAKAQINSVPGNHDTILRAIDNASRVAQMVRAAYALIPPEVRTVITTIQRTVQGAEGMIWPGAAMAGGGVLPMASGGRLHPNMSASMARIVPPNTWRVIGDRPTGDEAFIPINHSPRSVALLGVTANRMGFGLAPMRRGGYHPRDQRAWDWLEELLRRWRGGHGGGGGGSGAPKVAGTIGTSALQRITSSLAFGGGGGAASYMRTVKAPMTQLLQPAPSVPAPPSRGDGGRGGRDGSRTVYVDSNSALVQEIMRLIRTEVRKQGGDVQVALGR